MKKVTCPFLILSIILSLTGCREKEKSPSESPTIKKPFRIALVQMTVAGGQRDVNLEHAREQIRKAAAQGADIALLPEVMDLGWTHPSAPELAGSIPGGHTYEALATAARENGIFVCAGIVERDGETIYNSAVIISPEGELLIKHRKLNELDIAHDLYAQGDRINVCHTGLGTLGLMICADATAHDMTVQRSLGYMGADIILSPSAWAVPPEHDNAEDPYGDTWRDVYKPVAREFGMWIIGVSNVGWIPEGPWKGWRCIGCSLVIDPSGNEVLQAPYGAEADTIICLDIETLERPARGTGWWEYWNARQED
jgi:predicted amidohydrolase